MTPKYGNYDRDYDDDDDLVFHVNYIFNLVKGQKKTMV